MDGFQFQPLYLKGFSSLMTSEFLIFNFGESFSINGILLQMCGHGGRGRGGGIWQKLHKIFHFFPL